MSRGPWNKCESRSKIYKLYVIPSYAHETVSRKLRMAQMADNMELFKQFNDNPSFKKWLSDLVFNLTYNPEGKPFETPSNDSKKK